MTDEVLPYFGRPPARHPRPAAEVSALRGKRVILSLPDGFVYDIRAVGEVVNGPNGSSIDVATEEEYFRWMFTRVLPTTETFPVRLVWVE